jgi:hypothetical protein
MTFNYERNIFQNKMWSLGNKKQLGLKELPENQKEYSIFSILFSHNFKFQSFVANTVHLYQYKQEKAFEV